MRFRTYAEFLARHKWTIVVAVVVIVGVLFMSKQTGHFAAIAGEQGNDDAYISFRYAKNLADGNGLVYNVGERVEGYSNLLFTLIVAAGIRFAGEQWTYDYSIWINLAGAILMLILIGRSHLSRTAKIGGILLTGITPAFAFWAASGLESVAVAAIQVGIILLTEEMVRLKGTQHRLAIGLVVLCATSILLRADGFLIPLLALLYMGLRKRPESLAVAGAIAIAMAGQFGFRKSYYGDWWPNTYYAKVDGTLSDRLMSAYNVTSMLFWQTGIFLAVGVLVLGTGWYIWKKRGNVLMIPFRYWFFAAWCAYFTWIGGDIYQERFLLAFFPLGWITLCGAIRWGLANNQVEKRRLQTAIIAATLAIAVASPRWITYDRQAELNSVGWAFLGQMLKSAGPDATLAVDAAGKSPFFSGLKTIDMLGLNDKHIGRLPIQEGKFILGHSKSDWDYVMAKEPDFLASWAMMDSPMGMTEPESIIVAGKTLGEYKERGYKLHKLVNPSRMKSMPPPENPTEWELAIVTGFNYALLKKEGGKTKVASAAR